MLHYNVPDSTPTIKDDPLSIDVRYDCAELAVGDTLTATAKLAHNLPNPLAMVMVDLPIPAGFEVEAEDFQKLADKGTIASSDHAATNYCLPAGTGTGKSDDHFISFVRCHDAGEC